MSEDLSVRETGDLAPLTWDDVVADSGVGLVDLDGYGTGALMNDAARELLHLLRAGSAHPAGEQVDLADPGDRPGGRRGPLRVRGDLTELLGAYAPAMAETIRREGRTQGTPARPAGPVGPLAPSRVVSCRSATGQRLVRIDGYRRSGNRFLVTLVDVTAIERDAAADGAIGWELADTLAQRLVTAETALDLGRDEFGRRLVAEARALVQARIGEHVRRSGGVAPGVVRRQGGPEEVGSMDDGAR